MRIGSSLNSNRHYAAPFFGAYFLYYAGYCIFSSYIVLYLTERHYSATVCGVITSLTLLANLLMEPIGGYITDTFLTTRRYLLVCIGAVSLLCIFCTVFSARPFLLLPAMVVSAGIMYPFSQLMDAWVNMSREMDPGLIYSRIRAGGSIGFAAMSVLGGWYFKNNGWNHYFLAQMAVFLLMVPLLCILPDIRLGNRKNHAPGGQNQVSDREKMSPSPGRQAPHESHLSLAEGFRVIAENKRFGFCLLITTLYWFSHRPIGSYLSLLVAERGGDAGTYGSICGLGAVVESASLLLLAWLLKKKPMRPMVWMTAALASDLLRPACFLFFPGTSSLYLGQMMQSVSFALFYSSSLECFAGTADPRIRSFCISFGLTASSVGGTVAANLFGGVLCDRFGVELLILLSLGVAAVNLAVCCFGKRKFGDYYQNK